ncbi:MAG: NAD-dependent epimerase/dehydratase family protein [Fermentimonas sp.]|jgi:nucleoside-diphosphate-sugar epimerase
MTKEDILKDYLRPSQALIEDMSKINGDILILGAGGKMGPSMAKLATQAVKLSGIDKKVIAVSRFSDPAVVEDLKSHDVEVIKQDLLDEEGLDSLPKVANVIYMVGYKFGTTGNEPYTWIMNSYLPARVAQKFNKSRIVVFSSGNVYPFSEVTHGGTDENIPAAPLGEYAQSCLGRERMFQYFSQKNHTPILLYRLNYSNDVSYGILLEIARCVYEGRELNLSMGNVNVIWQKDANEIALRSLLHCEVPAKILNVTGPETISVRWVAHEFGKIFNKNVHFVSSEENTALLSNAAECFKLFGYPSVTLKQMIELIAKWVIERGKTINKPTHFQERGGKY